MTNHPDQPSGANEFAPLESTPAQPDPYAPVDYPATDAPPTVFGPGYAPPADYPPPAGYAQASGYPPPLPVGYPAAPGYPAAAGYPPPTGYPPPPQPYGGGYPYAADPYNPYRTVGPASNTNGMAIASLVVSLVSLFFCGLPSIVGLILGVIAMRDTKRTGQQGWGMALGGVIVGALPIVGWLVYWLFFIVFVGVVGTTSSTV